MDCPCSKAVSAGRTDHGRLQNNSASTKCATVSPVAGTGAVVAVGSSFSPFSSDGCCFVCCVCWSCLNSGSVSCGLPLEKIG